MLDALNENFISFHFSDEVETGFAGEQPVSNNLTGWNGRGSKNTLSFPLAIPVMNDLENLLW